MGKEANRWKVKKTQGFAESFLDEMISFQPAALPEMQTPG